MDIKMEGWKASLWERDGMVFVGGRASLVYTYELRFIKP